MNGSMGPRGDEVLEIFQKAQQLKICPNRIWAVAGENLPKIIPELHLILAQDGSQTNEHAECTSEFCEQAQRDFTGVQQRHECLTAKCTPTMAVSFPRDMLRRAAINEMPTAWALSGRNILKPHLPYMAISHVWSDGTGAGAWKDGAVNECLFKFFHDVATKFQCDGIWWDTISIPREKAARTMAIRKMHNNYENARITLVHDCFLRNWPWDPRTACFAIIMSPWFSRGWTALELMKSRKVKVIFKGAVIKDLDEEILAQENEPNISIREASMVIRNLRGTIATLNDLLTVLKSRYTSWPKDVAVIAALLVEVPVQERQHDIFKSILRKFGRIAPGHLFHNKTTMSNTFTWCPAKLFDLPLDTLDPSLIVNEHGDVEGVWRVIPVQPEISTKIWWNDTHPLIRRQLQYALEDPQQCILLAEYGVGLIRRALLVRKTHQAGRFQYIGAVYFRAELSEPSTQTETIVTISSFQDENKSNLLSNFSDMEGSNDTELLQHDQNPSPSQADRSESFRQAIWKGNYEAFIRFMEEDILEIPDKLGRRPLHLAAERGHRKMVETLLYLEVDVNAQCSKGQTPLHYAAWGGSFAVVQLFKDRTDQATKDNEGNTALHIAAQMGFASIVETLIAELPIDMGGSNGLTPLHYAVMNGEITVVEILDSANVDARDDKIGWTPLHCAVDNGNEDIVTLLLRRRANIDAKDKIVGWTPLHLAAIHGNTALIRILLAAGANDSAKDSYDWTPFKFAEINGHVEAAKLLPVSKNSKICGKAKYWTPLHCKAKNNERRLSDLLLRGNSDAYVNWGRDKWVPLQFAVDQNLEDTTRWLLDARSVWPITYDEETSEEWANLYNSDRREFAWKELKYREKDDASSGSGSFENISMAGGSDSSLEAPLTNLRGYGIRQHGPWTPMHWAARNDYALVIRILLERHEDMNATGPHFWTPLHFAAYFGNATATWLLLEAGATKDPRVSSGATPLCMAAREGHEVVVRLLLEAGARYEVKDERKQKPLSFAAEKGNTSIVKLLLKAGATSDTKDSRGQTPLLLACQKGNVTTVRHLLEAKVNVDIGDYDAVPPISIAARYGHIRIVQMLLDAGADINSRDIALHTPLMNASMCGHVEVVQLLLEAGADKGLRDNKNRKAIHWAAGPTSGMFYDFEHGDIKALFEEYSRASEHEDEEYQDEDDDEDADEDGVADKDNSNGEDEDNDEHSIIPGSIWKGLEPVVRLLLDSGEEVDSKGQKESTPLFAAALIGHKQVVQLLLQRGANINSRDRRYSTPLMAAAMNGKEEVAQLLLDRGAKEDLKDQEGKTALEYAIGDFWVEWKEEFGEDENPCIRQLQKDTRTVQSISEQPWRKRMSEAKAAAGKIKAPIRQRLLAAKGKVGSAPGYIKREFEKLDEEEKLTQKAKARNVFK